MPRSVLIVGGSGQTGRRLVRAMRDDRVAAPSSRELNLGDAGALRAFLRDHRFDVILIPGAARHIDWCEAHPDEARAINVHGPGLIAEESRGAHVVYFSSDAVFDGREGPYPVDAAVCPISVYGRTKVEGESRVRAARRWTVVRTCHIYSCDPGDNFFMDVVRRMRAGQPVRGFTDQVTTPTDADSLAEETVRLVNEGVGGIVNLSGRDMVSRYDFACEVVRACGLPGTVEPAAMPGNLRPPRSGLVSHLPGYREGIARHAAALRAGGDL